jgi:hypothetical protein
VAYVRTRSRPRYRIRARYHAIGTVIENCTFVHQTPEGKAHTGPRIVIESGSGYAEERWSPPPASLRGTGIRFGQRNGHGAILSGAHDFRRAGIMAGRPIRVSGSTRNDGVYRVRGSNGAIGKDFIEVEERLRAESPPGAINLTQPNITKGKLHMTGMRFLRRGKPLIIRSTRVEQLRFRVTGIGDSNRKQTETDLKMDGRAAHSSKQWKRIDEVSIEEGVVKGELRAGLHAPIRIRNVTFSGSEPQIVMRIDNRPYPEIPVHIEMKDIRAPAGSTIEAFDAREVRISLDGRPIKLPYTFGR